MEAVKIKLSNLCVNEGQIEGLPANPRFIRDEKFQKLKQSLIDDPEMLDIRELIVYPHPTMTGKYIIIGGNMRYNAAKELGMAELPCKILPDDTPVEKMRAYTIKDNVGYGEWDMDLLANEWETDELQDWGIDLPDFGEDVSSDDMIQEDDIPDKVKPKTKLGDIWILGEHRLCCGDSTDAGAVALLMNGEKADMVFTDPPYGVAIGDKNKELNKFQRSDRCVENIENDAISVNELYPILVKAMTNCRENCKDTACYFVTSPQGGELGLMMMMMKDAGLPVRHMLIWEKNSATFSLGRLDYDYQHEPIFYTWTKSHKNYRGGGISHDDMEIRQAKKVRFAPNNEARCARRKLFERGNSARGYCIRYVWRKWYDDYSVRTIRPKGKTNGTRPALLRCNCNKVGNING